MIRILLTILCVWLGYLACGLLCARLIVRWRPELFQRAGYFDRTSALLVMLFWWVAVLAVGIQFLLAPVQAAWENKLKE